MSINLLIDSGGIMLSYKCNSHCRHCLYAAGPEWKDWLDVQDAGRIFEGLVETQPYLRGFHLAGGEPFLDFERLLGVQRMATEFGIPIEYVETNAGWCVDEADALDKFRQLRDVGAPGILVSCSPFHSEHIPLDRVATAVRAGYDAFGPNGVVLWVPEFYRRISEIATDRTIPLDEYVKSVGKKAAGQAIRTGYSLISGGRVGYRLTEFFDLQSASVCREDRCRLELLESAHAHFDPYGNLIPSFCSGISLGDGRDLMGLMQSFELDSLPLVKMLVEGGPYALYKYAVKEWDYRPLDDGYVGKCHLCVDIRRWIQQKTNQFTELAPAQFYEQLK